MNQVKGIKLLPNNSVVLLVLPVGCELEASKDLEIHNSVENVASSGCWPTT